MNSVHSKRRGGAQEGGLAPAAATVQAQEPAAARACLAQLGVPQLENDAAAAMLQRRNRLGVQAGGQLRPLAAERASHVLVGQQLRVVPQLARPAREAAPQSGAGGNAGGARAGGLPAAGVTRVMGGGCS